MTTPVNVVTTATAANELGRPVAARPVRAVTSATATDELGRPVAADTVADSAATGARPVRVVSGTTTTDELGRPVTVRPVRGLDNFVSPTAAIAVVAARVNGALWDPGYLPSVLKDGGGRARPGDKVWRILDLSGNGIHFEQADPAKQLTLYLDAGGRPYLKGDGIDDYMASIIPANWTATDAIAVTAGLEKTSDTLAAVAMQSGVFGDNGTWRLSAPNANAATDISFVGRGTAAIVRSATAAAPAARVITGVMDIAPTGGLTDTTRIRANGAAGSGGAATIGTGNLASKTLYLCGASTGTSCFGGKFYGAGALPGQPVLADSVALEAHFNARMGGIF